MTVTKPTTKLAALLEKQDRTAAWLGRQLDVTRQQAAAWVNGRQPCPDRRRAQIITILGIHPQHGSFFDSDGVALPREDV